MSLFSDIDEKRERAGISQKDLCDRAQISPATYWKWRAGKDGITGRNLEKLTEALNALIAEKVAA